MLRRADDQVGFGQQAQIAGTRLSIAPVLDDGGQTRAGFIELLRHVAEVLTGNGQPKGDAFGAQPVEQVKEAIGALVVLPALVPEN